MNSSLLSTISSQQKASNPNSNCWVNASAGSGKTKVLIDRIIRLLLNNTKPDRILCLTFSRAAAGEMQERLLQHTQLLATISETDLTKQLSILGEPPTTEHLTKAKTMYSIIQKESVVIQTVHSFCKNLLQQQLGKKILYPSPRVMENFEENTYLNQAFENLIEDPSATTYLEEFLTFHGDGILFEYLCNSTRNEQNLNFEKIKSRLQELFDIASAPTFPQPSTEIDEYLNKLLNITISKEDVSKESKFAQIFLTQKGTVRAKILAASIQKQYPQAEEHLKNYGEKLAHYFSQKTRFDQMQKSLQFWQLQQIFKQHYSQLKEDHNLWDFQDLIEQTLQLLNLDTFDQILFELNYQIDHILIDEAQDTSIAQWHVIAQLVQGLFYQQSSNKSIFVVGDEKQSIYSFQGADVRIYKDMQNHFSTLCTSWESVNLVTSFRSGQKILKLIDAIFKENKNGLGDNVLEHTPYHKFNGHIEILPFVELEEITVEPWPIFETYLEVREPEQLLAEQILNHLEQKLTRGLFLESENRLATWDDVIILMRKRGTLMHELTNYCEKKCIPCSAFVPQNLMECLVVRDLLSAVEFMLMPLNDLNLAELLKSPWMQDIGKINETDLFNLCYNRKSSLWSEVQNYYPNHTKALNQILSSKVSTTYSYFQCAYDAMGTECELLHKFMDDVFKRFNLLNLSIRELVNHLHKFPPVFTQTYHQEGLQLLTVHGAKGLEAPIVVILDNGDEPTMKQDTMLYDPVAKFWFLKPPIAADTILTSALKSYHQQALEFEHNRLFYVALTRAKEHLILAGLPHEPNSHSWYWRVKECLK